MGTAIRPVVHDVMVVGNLDIFEIGGAEFLHLRNQKIRETFPAHAAGIRGAALAFEHVPVPRLLWRDHQRRLDPGKSRMRASLGGPSDTLCRERLPHQPRARGDSRSRLEECPPGKTLARSAHGALPKTSHRMYASVADQPCRGERFLRGEGTDGKTFIICTGDAVMVRDGKEHNVAMMVATMHPVAS